MCLHRETVGQHQVIALRDGQEEMVFAQAAENLVVLRAVGQTHKQFIDFGRAVHNDTVLACRIDEDSIILRNVEVFDGIPLSQVDHFGQRLTRRRGIEKAGGNERKHYSQLPALLFGAVTEPTWRPS